MLGIVTSRDTDFIPDRDTTLVAKVMTEKEKLITSDEGCTLEKANMIMRESRKGKLPIVDGEGNLTALIARADLLKQRDFPLASKSKKDGSLVVGAAVNARVSEREGEQLRRRNSRHSSSCAAPDRVNVSARISPHQQSRRSGDACRNSEKVFLFDSRVRE